MALRYMDTVPLGDQLGYESIAIAILHGKSTSDYYNQDGFPDIGMVVTPVYSAIIATVYMVFGEKPAAVYILQILMNLFIVLIFYYLLKKFSNSIFAFSVSVFLSFYYVLWRMNFSLMMEISSILFLFVIAYFTFRFLQNFNKKEFFIITVLWSLLIFMNNRFIVHFCILYLFWSIIFLINRKFPIQNQVYAAIILIFVLLPWHIRQYTVYERFVIFKPLRTGFLNPDLVGKFMGDEIKSAKEFKSYEYYIEHVKDATIRPENKKKFLKEFTIEKYNELKNRFESRTRFDRYLLNFFENFRITRTKISLSGGVDSRITPPASKIHNTVNLLFLAPAFFLFPLGLFYSFKNRSLFFISLIVIVFSNILVHTILFCLDRYRLLTVPFIFLISAYGLYQLFFNYRMNKKIKMLTVQ